MCATPYQEITCPCGLVFYLYGVNFWKGEKKERKRKSSTVACIFSRLSRVWCNLASKHGFFGMVNEECAEIITTATRNEKISGGMMMLLRCNAAIVFICVAYLLSHHLFPHYIYLCMLGWLMTLILLLMVIVMLCFIRVDMTDLRFWLRTGFAIYTKAHLLFVLHGVSCNNRTRTIQNSICSCCFLVVDLFILFSPALVDCRVV